MERREREQREEEIRVKHLPVQFKRINLHSDETNPPPRVSYSTDTQITALFLYI